jgi:hypothetical protein
MEREDLGMTRRETILADLQDRSWIDAEIARLQGVSRERVTRVYHHPTGIRATDITTYRTPPP